MKTSGTHRAAGQKIDRETLVNRPLSAGLNVAGCTVGPIQARPKAIKMRSSMVANIFVRAP